MIILYTIDVDFRVLEADSRSLHSLTSQHRRLSPGSSDPAAVCDAELSRGDSMSSLVSGASLGSFTGSSQPTEECMLTLFDIYHALCGEKRPL